MHKVTTSSSSSLVSVGINLNIGFVCACFAGRNGSQPNGSPAVPQREQLLQILNKINALPLPMDLVSKLNSIGVLARKNLDQPSVMNSRNDVNGGASSSPSTMDLLAVLSTTLGSSAPEAIAFLSQGGFGSSDKTKLTSSDHAPTTTSSEKRTLEFPSFVGEEVREPAAVTRLLLRTLDLLAYLYSCSPLHQRTRGDNRRLHLRESTTPPRAATPLRIDRRLLHHQSCRSCSQCRHLLKP